MPKKFNSVQQKELDALANMADSEIDLSDIPEVKSLAGGVRGMFYRPATKQITIRLGEPDIEMAIKLSQAKGIAYETYIKNLLHEALLRETVASS